MSEKVRVKLPVKDVEVLELLAQKMGKSAEELLEEILRDYLEACRQNPNKLKEYLLRLDEEAKKAGLSINEFIDRENDEFLKWLKD